MYVTAYGATQEVTGSFHTITTSDDILLLDCGLYQGRRKECEEKNRHFLVDPKSISNVILSHAHIDHSGRLPMLTDQGFTGNIFCTRATADACAYLLKDSANIQAGDSSYLNYKTVKKFLERAKQGDNPGNISRAELKEMQEILKSDDYRLKARLILEVAQKNNLEIVRPIYSQESVDRCLPAFKGIPYGTPFTVGKNTTCTQYEAGHILGSAVSIIQRKTSSGRIKNIMYSGDLGRFDKPIIKDPNLDFPPEHRNIDLCLMESTYGNRLHEPVTAIKPILKKVLTETFERGGSVLVPCFAFGRTQELIYFLHELYRDGEVPRRPIYIDSPLATNLTTVFGEHPEDYDEATHRSFLEMRMSPFSFEHLHFVQNVEESMALNRDSRSHIILAGSGMCEGGRILHHLRHRIHNERNTVLIVGYMGENTFGRLLHEKGKEYAESGRQGDAPMVRFYGKDYPLRAHVVSLGGLSGHGDRDEMTRVLQDSNLNVKSIALVHGEVEQSLAFADHLRGKGFDVSIPLKGDRVPV